MIKGFTLAELLVVIGVLGVMATFTIPKILNSNLLVQQKAIAKEAAGALSAAYQTYLVTRTV